MPWTYAQASGRLLSPAGIVIATGYSGTGQFKNQPSLQNVKDKGPIPCGWYAMLEPRDTEDHGPYAIPLVPDPHNSMQGRSGFMIHGDNVFKPGTGSDGCIVLDRFTRERIWDSGDHLLQVVPEINDTPMVQSA